MPRACPNSAIIFSFDLDEFLMNFSPPNIQLTSSMEAGTL
jgi:hypothetical protein